MTEETEQRMKAIGIDLGTTNSAVAHYDPERSAPAIVANGESKNLTPSVVGVRRREGAQSLLVGETAVNWAGMHPKDAVVSVKRLMGRDFADTSVTEARGRLSYEIVPGPDEDPRAHVVFGGQTCSPAEVSSVILDRLVRDASRTLGEQVTHAVITVPAYFRDAQRAATREAAERAGLVVKKIIDEPTAAAVAFGLHKQAGERSRVLVYDLGGGTFDISILNAVKDREGQGQFQVLRFDGDSWLGGDDFDLAIVERIIDWVRENCGLDPAEDKAFLFTAKQHAERAKRQLNDLEETDIIIPGAHRTADGTLVDVEMPLSRDDFNAAIEPLVARTMSLVQQTLDRQGLSPEHISDVLLVGGSTLTRKVYEAVESFFGKEKVRRNINPMECVALGAGILAGTLHGVECPDPQCGQVNEESAKACECGRSLSDARAVGRTGLYEVTGVAMGIAAVKGSERDVFVPIIPSGTPYPLPEPKQQSFHATDSRLIRVPVYEGNSPIASQNDEQGVIEFELPQEIDVNRRVDVTFNYSADRIITVRISVPGTDMVKEATPSRERPRTPPPEQPVEIDSAGLRQVLSNIEEDAREFLQRYEVYIEQAQAMKVHRDIEQAQRALTFGDSSEYQRLGNLLLADMYHHCGIASQFMQAERAVNGAPPETARQINEAVDHVQRAQREGNREQATQQARNLANLVAAAREARRVPVMPDAEDTDALLRVMKGTNGE